LWFKFGAHDDVSHAMGTGFGIVGVDTWLDVAPQVETATSRPMSNTHHPPCIQIIARIQTPSANIRRNLNSLLNEVGKHHPQALIYPLTVASKSTSASRMGAAVAIMERMKEHSATIVEQVRVFHPDSCFNNGLSFPPQALIVSHELIRVAILWHELWHEGLEEASRLYFTEKNPEGMIAALEPLHNMLEAVSSCMRTVDHFVISDASGSGNCSRNLFRSSVRAGPT
jgi:serine/threonine-protein kinase mTOR